MAIHNIDNPFTSLKFRNLVLRFIVLSFLNGFLLLFLERGSSLKLNQQDSVIIIYIWLFVLLCLWTVKDFGRLRAKVKYVVGDFPTNYNWLRLTWLVPLTIIFSVSCCH